MLRLTGRSGSSEPPEPVPVGSFATNGLVELLATDRLGGMLAMERAFSNGVGNDVRLYEVRALRAPWSRGDQPLRKRELINFGTATGLTIDNLEGMTFGPRLRDGRELLIVVSDNNFSSGQVTQFLAFAVRFGGF